MEITNAIASMATQMSQKEVATAVSTVALKKGLDIQKDAVLQLLQSMDTVSISSEAMRLNASNNLIK